VQAIELYILGWREHDVIHLKLAAANDLDP